MSSFIPFGGNRVLRLGLAAFLALAPVIAEAKLGGGSSSGSRGSRTMSAPPSTSTAPSSAQPMQRTTTPQMAPGASSAARPQAPLSTPAAGGFFGGGFGRGLLGGLVGAGLIGMFMGHGFMGGLGGVMSMIGLLLQVGLLAMLAMFAWNWFARRRQQEPVMGGMGAAGYAHRSAAGVDPGPVQGGGFGGFAGGAPRAPQTTPITPTEVDFNAFEKLLSATQIAYGQENIAELRKLATEEMIYYFQSDIDEAKRKGVASRVSDVKLLQGDLSEAWREGGDEYATVAMRFSLIDVTVDRVTGRVVEGDPSKPAESTEIWTFLRPAGAGPDAWRLSAIQQTA